METINNLIKPSRLLLVTLLSLASVSLPVNAGKLYKWVDESGRVHYSDSMPPEDVRREHTYMDERGLTVNKVGAAKTQEEIEQQEALKRLQKEQQVLIKEQQAADRVLLRTFRSEDDILMARDGQLRAVDLSLQVINSNIRQLKSKLEEMQRNAASLELSGEAVSAEYLQRIDRKRQSLKESYQSIVHRERDKNRIRIAFARDLERFRVLKRLSRKPDDKLETAQSEEGLSNVYHCQGESRCEASWQAAKQYLHSHATTPVRMLAENILMTGQPVKAQDISVTMSRLTDSITRQTIIFMDLQCKDTPEGTAFCASEPVRQIRNGFNAAVAER
ncbi:MAG: DUF4124 domain-containing protein [endosymbiont of Escarpia spicata]|uniref:DUF4124 domain-containing protein n=1 Tax=endosymbiont of Escarpia spicata TaxID=2200908 RepID=A0A370DB14_9GAMM|nr:MAG: DUF4124 domain-containing protein [endosymbiont of Escarpia spicata]